MNYQYRLLAQADADSIAKPSDAESCFLDGQSLPERIDMLLIAATTADAQARCLKEMADTWAYQAKAKQEHADSLRAQAAQLMHENNIKHAPGMVKASLQIAERVVVPDVDALRQWADNHSLSPFGSDLYATKTTYVPNKAAIKTAIENGEQLPAQIVTSHYVRISKPRTTTEGDE